LLLLLTLPAAAEIKVDHEEGVDFGGYKTYAWQPGTDAAREPVQRAIVKAVDRQLKAAGLRPVRDRRADLHVTTHAYAKMDSSIRSNYVNLPTYDVGILSAEYITTTTGVLMVDLVDGATEQPVWRGMATEVMSDPDEAKLLKKVDKVTRKMFKRFPPS
jgi:hypothetical protein